MSSRIASLLLTLVFYFLTSCTSPPKPVTKSPLDYPPELEAVHDLIVKRKTADARLKIGDYLNKAENIHWYGHAYFLKGFLYELDEDYGNAIKFYRSAIQHGSQYESRVEAKALYNLSFVYEKIDERDRLLVTLIDLMKRREYFDVLTGQVEIPARLAATYASQGRMKEALIFHREARQNFKDMVRNQKFRAQKSEISKALYYLGLATYDQNNEAFADLVKKLEAGQKYFLASAEASDSTWSEKSVTRLKALYDKAWGQVLEFQPKGFDHDPQAKKKQQHRRQLVMASSLYDLMFLLRAEEFPMSDVNLRSKAIMDNTQAWIDRIEKFAIGLSVGPETIRSQKIKNKRLARYVEEEQQPVKINKEQASQKKASSPQSNDHKQELPAKGDIGKDPNL